MDGTRAALIALVVAACFFGLDGARAGSATNPDMTDPSGDAVDRATNTPLAIPGLDLTAVWISTTANDIIFTWKVQDLPNGPGGNAYDWSVRFHLDGVPMVAQVQWDAAQPGGLGFLGQTGAGQSPPTSLGFSASDDTVTLTAPRSFDLATFSYSADDGDALTNPVASTTYWRSGLTGTGIAYEADSTSPGSTITLGAPSTTNPHLKPRPVQTVVAAAPGAPTDVRFEARDATGVALATTLTATMSEPGWTVEPATQTLNVPPNGQGQVVFAVTPPADAATGSFAVLRVTGGDQPLSVLVASSQEAAEALRATPEPTRPLTRTQTWYLQGKTSDPQSTTVKAVFPGRLVASAPTTGAGEESIVQFQGQGSERAPAGVWTVTSPADAPYTLSGEARLSVALRTNGVGDGKVRALLGVAPLPLEWSSPPPGTLELRPVTTSTTSTGTAVVQARGDIGSFRVGAGDRLALSLYVEKSTGNGQAFVLAYGAAQPSKLELRVTQNASGSLAAVALPAAKQAAYGATVPFGASLEAALVDQAGVAQPLTLATTPATLVVGSGADPAATTTRAAFNRTDPAGHRRVFPFDVAPGMASVEVMVDGAHATDRFADHNFDLEVYNVSGTARTLVKASRAHGPDERLTLTYADLDRHGRGRYEAVVLLQQVASTGTTLDTTIPYDLTLAPKAVATFADARTDARLLWSYTGFAEGNYTVRLRSADGLDLAQTYRLTDVGPTIPPVARFDLGRVAPKAREEVAFNDSSTDVDGRIVNWTWDFGDGTKAYTPNATHAYARPGAYTVTLTVRDDMDASSLPATRLLTIVNLPPVVAFRYEPQAPLAGQAVSFRDDSSDPDGRIVSWQWDFGDGAVSIDRNTTHVFAAPGNYTVRLVVVDDPPFAPAGVALERVVVVVRDATTLVAPVADFAAPTSARVGEPIAFVDGTHAAPNATLLHAWDFGDGNVSNLASPSHAYAVPGTYRVTLTVALQGHPELTSQLTRTLRVLQSPVGLDFTWAPPNPVAGQDVVFTDVSALDAQWLRAWEFGDQTIASGSPTRHAFAAPGDHTVSLTVTGPDGSSRTVSHVVAIAPAALRTGEVDDAPPTRILTGTLAAYTDAYGAGEAHDEAYGSELRDAELEGSLPGAGDYLAPVDGRLVYVQGTFPARPLDARWTNDQLVARNAVNASTVLRAGIVETGVGDAYARALPPTKLALDGQDVDLGQLTTLAPDRDDAADGLLSTRVTLDLGDLQVTRSLALLEGTAHTDVLTRVVAAPGTPLSLTTRSELPAGEGAWVAWPQGSSIHVALAQDVTGTAIDAAGLPNLWIATFDPRDGAAHGVVLSGDLDRARLTLTGGVLQIDAERAAEGTLLAAEYLVAYQVRGADSTRYAGVAEIARQDAEEIGTVLLDGERVAATAWAGSGAEVRASSSTGARQWWGSLMGTTRTWDLEVQALPDQAGKRLRLILPASVLDEGGFEVRLDGAVVQQVGAAADDDTLLLTFAIDHFSLRHVQIKTVVPGVPPIFLWLTLGLGAVVGGESFFILSRQLKSRAAARAFDEPGSPPRAPPTQASFAPPSGAPPASAPARGMGGELLPQSETVRRALGGQTGLSSKPVEEAKQGEYRSALLKKLAAEGVASGGKRARKCKQCGGVVEDPTIRTCPDCKAYMAP